MELPFLNVHSLQAAGQNFKRLIEQFPLSADDIEFPEAVEALPTTNLYVGRRIVFKASTGVYWDLVYTGEETYPWAKIGGPALRAVESTTKESKAETDQTSGSPTITVPLACEARFNFGAINVQLFGTSQANGYCDLYIDGSSTRNAFVNAGTQFGGGPLYAQYVTTIAKSKVAATRYKVNNGQEFHWERLFIEVDPLRVG